jgi:lysophospholipase L1-like esterase
MERATLARVALVGAALALVTTGCSLVVATTASPARVSAAGSAIVPVTEGDGSGVRVAVVGDSLTAGGGRLLSDGLDADTWMTYAQGDGVEYVGGWARGGSTVEQQAAAVRPIHDVDVLVLMSGTNDVRTGVGFAAARASYESIIDTVDAREVVVAAIPPYDRDPSSAARYERDLERWVATTDHVFVDPWLPVRAGEAWAPGASTDGIHPTRAGYERLGRSLREAILDAGVAPGVLRADQGPVGADPVPTGGSVVGGS